MILASQMPHILRQHLEYSRKRLRSLTMKISLMGSGQAFLKQCHQVLEDISPEHILKDDSKNKLLYALCLLWLQRRSQEPCQPIQFHAKNLLYEHCVRDWFIQCGIDRSFARARETIPSNPFNIDLPIIMEQDWETESDYTIFNTASQTIRKNMASFHNISFDDYPRVINEAMKPLHDIVNYRNQHYKEIILNACQDAQFLLTLLRRETIEKLLSISSQIIHYETEARKALEIYIKSATTSTGNIEKLTVDFLEKANMAWGIDVTLNMQRKNLEVILKLAQPLSDPPSNEILKSYILSALPNTPDYRTLEEFRDVMQAQYEAEKTAITMTRLRK